MKLQARPSPIKRGSAPQVRRVAVAAIMKSAQQPPAAPKPVEARVAAQAPAPRPARPVARARARTNGKGPNCLWPIGDPGDQDFHFCGAPAVAGKPYCDEHCARAYIVRNRSDSEAA